MMILQSMASAFPEKRMTQLEVWELIAGSTAAGKLRQHSLRLLERVLKGESGIQSRCFGYPQLETVFSATPDDLARGFEVAAPRLAGQALTKALSNSGSAASDLDALFVATCTGYICPGVSSHIAEQFGMREDIFLQDIVGIGCAAAIPMLRAAHGFLAANPGAKVACVAVEICSAAFYLEDDPGQLISLCLFGDGASASVWSTRNVASGWVIDGFSSLHQPSAREEIRFVKSGGGYLKNKLSREVPGLSARAVKKLRDADRGTDLVPVTHGGGRDVLTSIERELGIQAGALATEREVLREQGNLSSPSVLVALERRIAAAMGQPQPEGFWLCSFGAGFSAHSAQLRRDA
jgi:alkylresorcinol/alkylpyrone synthase